MTSMKCLTVFLVEATMAMAGDNVVCERQATCYGEF